MRCTILSSTLLALALTQTTLAAPKCKAVKGNVGKALYFITNEDDNSVAAMAIGADGSLYGAKAISTGGKGAASIDGSTGNPAEKDPLVSQSSVNVVGQVSHLFFNLF